MLIDANLFDQITRRAGTLPDWQGEFVDAAIARAQTALGSRNLRERWKYTRPARIVDTWTSTSERRKLVTGNGAGLDIQALEAAPQPGANQALRALIDQRERWQHYPLADLVLADPACGSLVTVAANSQAEIQVDLPAQPAYALIRIESGAQAILNLRQADPVGGFACFLAIDLAPGASLTTAQTLDIGQGENWLLSNVRLEQDARWTGEMHTLSTGGLLRAETHAQICGSGADVNLRGAAVAVNGAKIDQHIEITHQAPGATSVQRFHTATGNRSANTFNGRIHIAKGAGQTDARLSNRNLLLAPGADVNTKPELEIYADDVSCAHGATVGQLDADAVHYLRSRGIDSAGAQRLLLKAFLLECLHGESANTVAERAMDLLQHESVVA